MAENFKNEYEELMKLGESAGISELMEFYGGYQEYFKECKEYFKILNPEIDFSTSNYTHIINE